MKKSLIAMALMFGAVMFVMPSCGGDKEEKKYNCSCPNTSFADKTGLSEADKNTYVTDCAKQSQTTAGTESAQGAKPKESPAGEADCK
jgi:hypothetical protein